jgi:hypothetical protein
MVSDALCRTIGDMLSADVRVAAGRTLSILLTASEQASLGIVDSRRLLEFKSGRAYAKRALRMLGVDEIDLPIGCGGSPVWPSGVVGSITHVRCADGDMYAAAAAARLQEISAIGIDFEMADSLPPDVWPHVMRTGEIERLFSLPERARGIEAHYIWCAKEAIAKILGGPFDPCAIEVERDRENGHFIGSFTSPDRRDVLAGLRGRTACFGDLIIATAVLPNSSGRLRAAH